jgi:hypothetical protein
VFSQSVHHIILTSMLLVYEQDLFIICRFHRSLAEIRNEIRSGVGLGLSATNSFLSELTVTKTKDCPIDIAMEDVILETSMGTVVCEMYYDHAPRTCKNFVELVRLHTL